MKTIYALLSFSLFTLCACNSSENKPAEQEHVVNKPDSMPADNTSVADSANGNANVGMGGSN